MENRIIYDLDFIRKCFPVSLHKTVENVISEIKFKSKENLKKYEVYYNGELLFIPNRLYWEIRDEELNYERIESLMYSCLLTRHHNGFVRQKHLKIVFDNFENWCIPFIYKLMGEYVYEILLDIETFINKNDKTEFIKFAFQNRDFCNLIKQRNISYWDCYYKHKCPILKEFPCFNILSKFAKQ